MAKYTYASSRRRVNHRGIAAVLVAIAVVGVGATATSRYLTTKNIKNAEISIEQMEKDKIKLQEELETLETTTKTLEDEATALEEALWRYEPVVIPESMK